MYARPLDFTPGTNSKYSNYGYLLASTVVEHVTGMGFFDYVSTTLLQPANIADVQVWPTVASPRPPQEVIHEDEGLGLSAVDVNSPLLVPAIYGGDEEIKEVGVACAGLAASATALTQFIHLHAVWGCTRCGATTRGLRTEGSAGSGALAARRARRRWRCRAVMASTGPSPLTPAPGRRRVRPHSTI
jgi:CubicO group peptidase (beta-lactamase class C family)